MNPSAATKIRLGLTLRVGLYVFFILLCYNVLPFLLIPVSGLLLGAVMTVFASAAISNALLVRIFGVAPPGPEPPEDAPARPPARLADIGLGWNPASMNNLLMGALAGAGAALLVLLPPVIAGAAKFVKAPDFPASIGSALFIVFVLLFGAIGEEFLFHGYGFQVLVGSLGPFATILPTGVLFAFAHINNTNISTMGLVNTALWGVVLGYAVVRAGDLWLPIGLHYGWNVVLPFFGTNLSGFKMGVTGYALQWSTGDLWSGGAYGVEGSLLTTFVVILLMVYLVKAPVKRQYPALLGAQPED